MAVAVTFDRDHLTVTLSGWDRLLSLKAHLAVPLIAISSVEAKSREEIQALPGRWLRLPGTYVPSMVHHGSYGLRPNRDFWALFREERVLVIRMDGWDYKRIVLGMADPDSLAAELTKAIA